MHRIIVSIFTLLLFILSSTYSFSQKRKHKYEYGLSTNISSSSKLPFWLLSNKNGIVPNANNGILDVSFYSPFIGTNKNKFDFSYGSSFIGSYDSNANFLVDELYVSSRIFNLGIDIGIKHKDIKFDGLSATNGNVFFSNNSRSYPLISIGFYDYVPIPYLGNWLSIKGQYSEGVLLDDRFVKNTRVHNKDIHIKIGGNRRLNLVVGFQHIAQWAGESSSKVYGKLASDFKNYVRVIQSKGGTDESNFFEWENSVGNHLGGWDLSLKYKFNSFDVELYRQTMLEDHSGIYITRPDGVTGLFVKFKGQKHFVNSVLYEHYFTKFQSGSTPGGTLKPDGSFYTGMDNFFNNGVYRSGWTYYGNTIGLPFFYPKLNGDNISEGVYNNRIIGHHFGLGGNLSSELEYKALISYTINYGTYSRVISKDNRDQFSSMLEIFWIKNNLPFNLSFTVAYDKGELLGDNLGFSFKIFKTGLFN